MATTEVPFLLGAAFINQAVRGTIEPGVAIGAGSGTGGAINNIADGAVLGDPDAGVGSSGISFGFAKNSSEKAPATGSFTRNFANFVSYAIDSASITIPLKGNGFTTSTPLAVEFRPDLGVAALLRSIGLTGAANGATWRYKPASVGLITADFYFGNASNNGGRIRAMDLEAASGTFNFTPGEPASLEVALGGVFESYDEAGSWPAEPFQYGNQSTLSAPAVVNVAFTWGPSAPTTRALGFSELSITIDNAQDNVPSSNSLTGFAPRQTDRTIVATGVIDSAAAEVLYELDQLGEDLIANADPLTFTVGTPAGAAQTANAYRITMPTPELTKLEKADPLGSSDAWNVELTARGATANSEFELVYL